MIKVIREYESSIIDRLKHNFVADGSYSIDVMTEEFKQSMSAYPDKFLVLIAYDDEDITGHLIAFKPHNRNYIVFDQVHNSIVGFEGIATANIAFKMMIEWAKSLGCDEIRMETERHSVAEKCLRYWGFEEKGVSLRLDLSNDK
jgi:hypothetical protein